MSESDERIERVKSEVEGLLDKLILTSEEKEFATAHAKIIHDGITEAYLQLNDDLFARTRALSAAAAVALALVTVSDWANKIDTDFPPIER